jgi:hydrogenase maturation protease
MGELRRGAAVAPRAATTTPVRILGIGSPFGDDRFGWRVAEALRQTGVCERYPPGLVSVAACDRPGSLLLELMEGAELALLVDAVQAGAAVGTLLRLEGEQIAAACGPISSHGLGVASALALGRALGCLPEHVVLWGVEAGEQSFTDSPLHPQVEAAVPPLLAELCADVEGFLAQRRLPAAAALGVRPAA